MKILYTNDTHSYLDDFARRSWLIKKLRDADALLLDSGDSVSGSIYYNLYEGAMEARLLSMLGYDAITFGNHDFDRGSAGVANFLKHLTIPLISSNVDISKDPLLNQHLIFPYAVKQKMGIFALTTLETLDNAESSPETVFLDPIETAKAIVKKLQELEVKGIILLSHLGKTKDEELAQAVPDIDAIVGGHTHDALGEPHYIGKTLILQAGCHGKYLGEADLEAGTVTLHSIDETVPEDPELIPFIREMQAARDQYASLPIAETAVRLDGDRHQQKSRETNLGNLVVDAYFHKAKALGFAPDCGILNGLGIRTSIEAGPITLGDLIKVLPYSKSLMVLRTTGANIKQALSHGLYPQVSQLKIRYEEGQLAEVLLKGKPLEDHKLYTVATNTFCGTGKDGYHHGFSGAEILSENISLDVDILREYMNSLPQPIRYEPEGRIVKI